MWKLLTIFITYPLLSFMLTLIIFTSTKFINSMMHAFIFALYSQLFLNKTKKKFSCIYHFVKFSLLSVDEFSYVILFLQLNFSAGNYTTCEST